MNDLTTAAVERLTAQLGEALFGEPGLSLMEIANRRAEIEQMAKDAGRYRWLTAENDWDIQPRVLMEDGVTLSVTVYSPQRLFDRFGEMDDIGGAIDAAMGAMKEQTE